MKLDHTQTYTDNLPNLKFSVTGTWTFKEDLPLEVIDVIFFGGREEATQNSKVVEVKFPTMKEALDKAARVNQDLATFGAEIKRLEIG